jgi:hypothetical protein
MPASFLRPLSISSSFCLLCFACGGIANVGLGTGGGDDAGLDTSTGNDARPPLEGGTRVLCTMDAQCGPGEACALPAQSAEVCPPGDPAIRPQCVKLSDEACNQVTIESACSCNGQTVMWTSGCTGLPMGWVPGYVKHLGPCAKDGAADSYPARCLTDSDCKSDERCGFSVEAACAAVGECLPQSDFPMCEVLCGPSCACDGTSILDDAVCCGGQYASKPIQHRGECDSDGF